MQMSTYAWDSSASMLYLDNGQDCYLSALWMSPHKPWQQLQEAVDNVHWAGIGKVDPAKISPLQADAEKDDRLRSNSTFRALWAPRS